MIVDLHDVIMDEIHKGKELYNKLPPDDKECLVAYIMSILYEHAREGGTYRYLLYERFGLQDYGLQQFAGMFAIHNLISGNLDEQI